MRTGNCAPPPTGSLLRSTPPHPPSPHCARAAATYQVNSAPLPPPLQPCDHAALMAAGAATGAPVLRFFIEPVVRAVTWALRRGYARVALAGLSGGGWTTTLAAALDARLALSVPIAGSIPCDFRHTSWDAEQFCDAAWARAANYSTLYALAALEAGRASVQLLHEADPCCHHGCGRHARIAEYGARVAAATAGAFRTAVTRGNVHEVNPRDRVILAALLDAYARGAPLPPLDALPYDLMRGGS